MFIPPPPSVDRSQPLSWWALLEGADWRHPQGPSTSIDDRMEHPVVHLAYEDAVAYAQWAGKRLPTADEWEVAARGGLVEQDYAWGSEMTPGGQWLANVWQGPFPWINEQCDGWFWTSPVGSFPANGYGLLDMWECLGVDVDLVPSTQRVNRNDGSSRAGHSYVRIIIATGFVRLH